MGFERIVKYLDLRRAAKDTTLVPKPHTLYPSRAIKKVQDIITLPAFSLINFIVFPYPKPRLLFQYNVTVGYDFSMAFPDIQVSNTDPVLGGGSFLTRGRLFVKWREGSTVFRYALNIGGLTLGSSFAYILAMENNRYTNQVIRSNCCFEFWLSSLVVAGSPGLNIPFRIQLSKLRNPAYAEDQGTTIDIAAPLLIADLGFDLPHALPLTQENLVWLDNV